MRCCSLETLDLYIQSDIVLPLSSNGRKMIELLQKRALLVLLGIALLGVVVYSNSFKVPFQFDDDMYVVTNPVIKDFHYFLSPRETATASPLSPALRFAFMTRIVGYLTLAVNYNVHGLNVFGYHVVNLLLHILNAWMVFLIATHIFKVSTFHPAEPDGDASIGIPLFVALLFLCHPIQTHAVTYITSRFVVLASFFSLLSIVSYIRSRTAQDRSSQIFWKIVAILSAVAGMLTKEFTFTLPFVVAMYEFSFFKSKWRERLHALWPYVLIIPIIPLLVFIQQGSLSSLDSTMRTITAADVNHISRFDYLLTQFRVINLYLRLLILPYGQNIDHDIPVQNSLASPAVLGSLFLILTLLSCAGYGMWRSRRTGEALEYRTVSFGIFWFFITLAVESSIIPLGELSAEYRLYLPSVGIIIAVVSLGSVAIRRFSLNRKVVLSIASSLVIVLCLLTFLRDRIWQSPISLWQDASFKSPAIARPYYNLGLSLNKSGRLIDAVSMYERAIAINPNYYLALNNLGAALNDLDRPNEAISVLEQAITNRPNNPEAYYNLGLTYLLLRDNIMAINYLSRAITLKPTDTDAVINLAVAYNRVGRFAETIRLLENAYDRIADRTEGHFNLCIAYSKQGNQEAVDRELQIVYRLNPKVGRQLEDYIR